MSFGGGDEAQKVIFNRYKIANDKEGAALMPDAVFPKVQFKMRKDQSVAEMESMWMVGFIDHETQSSSSKHIQRLKNFLELPHGVVGPAARDALATHYKQQEKLQRSMAPTRSVLNDNDSQRLSKLMKELATKPKKTMNAGRAAYEKENKKILKMRRLKRPTENVVQVGSDNMNDIFELQRLHTRAAVRIQKAYRTYLAMQFWRNYILKVKAVVKIQRIARGMISRTIIKIWHMRRWSLTVIVQAVARACTTRTVQNTIDIWEHNNVILIQKNMRRYLGKKRHWRFKYHQSAIHIQCLWRALVGRARSYKLWMHNKIIRICCLVRGHLGRVRYRKLRVAMVNATCIVQRYFRGSLGRTRRNNLMWKRESESRTSILEILAVEAEQTMHTRDRLVRVLESKGWDGKISGLRKKVKNDYAEVRQFEYDYLELKRERSQLSPRAIEQDWGNALDKDIRDHRRFITDKKLETIFETSLLLRRMEEAREKNNKRIEAAQFEIDEIGRWRQAELRDMFARESRNKWGASFALEKRRAVADQKRKWAVRYYTAVGKPDKGRRPGHLWDPDSFAGQERDVFSLADRDILSEFTENEHHLLGSKESLEVLEAQLQSTNITNQVEQFNTLVAPFWKHMEGGHLLKMAQDIRNPPATQSEKWTHEERARKKAEILEGVVDEGKELPVLPKPKPAHKHRTRIKPSRIPWKLLEELDMEKTKLEKDQRDCQHLLDKL
jgi:hypothetical protein